MFYLDIKLLKYEPNLIHMIEHIEHLDKSHISLISSLVN